jgi:hypothetical protein
MGLFINKGKHPEVFKNLVARNENNQELHRKDYLKEILQIQHSTNLSLSQSLDELKLHNHKQKEFQSIQWDDLNNQLNDMKRREFEHHNLDFQIMERLKNLEEKQKTIYAFLENETEHKLEIMNEMQIQNRIFQEMAMQIEKYEELTQRLSEQIEKHHVGLTEKIQQYEGFQTEVLSRLDKHEQLNQHLSEQMQIQTNLDQKLEKQISQQESYQTEILTRIDNQEALIEKLARQIYHFRSIIFERSNFLAEKIENGYKLTTSYVHKLFTSSEQPLTFYRFKNKEEDHQRQPE